MCLAVPARVVELLPRRRARADLDGLELEISTDLVPEVAAGQYVIVHAGYALSIMDEREAEETLRLLEEIAQSAGSGREEAHASGELPEP
jgi:hydrogenase expression/formation protein HypC